MTSKADVIREKLKELYELGDATVYDKCWCDTDETIIQYWEFVL